MFPALFPTARAALLAADVVRMTLLLVVVVGVEVIVVGAGGREDFWG